MKYYIVLEVNSYDYDEPTIHLLTKDKTMAYATAEKIAQRLYNKAKKTTDNEVEIIEHEKYWLIREYDANFGQNYWSAEIQIHEYDYKGV